MSGLVTLVGAGPGGSELLTLGGAAALQQAEAVVFDRLVDDSILALIPEKAARYDVGKTSGHHPVPQDEINALLVRLGQEGKRTVRLKGGDCFLFGRGGEECEALAAAGVEFRVISGVTSALAAPASAGIPVTHRDFCSSLHIVTAHARAGKEPEIDFEALVRNGGTLVFLMGLSALESVCAGLKRAGMAADTPAAVIENGCRPQMRKVVTTLADLPEQVRRAELHSPAIIVVGAVCALSDMFDRLTPLPLHGKTMIVSRPRGRAGTLTERLRALGALAAVCPCIETRGIDCAAALNEALRQTHDWAVFTSAAGVEETVHALKKAGRDLRALYGCRLAAVGRATADALAALGLTADLMPETFDGLHLAEALIACRPIRPLLLRGAQATRELPDALAAAGIAFDEVAVYETVETPDEARQFLPAHADGAVFTSASTVHGLASAAGVDYLRGMTAYCIGARTAEAAARYEMKIRIAAQATIDSLIDAILEE